MKPSIYLSGAIEKSKDPFNWRNEVKESLLQYYDVIIPDKIKVPKKCSFLYKQKVINNIVIRDINNLIRCEHFLVKIDSAVLKGAGTLSEITFAAIYNKPIVCYFDDITIQDVPGWIQGCLYDATILNGVKDAIKYFKCYRQLYGKHKD
jgi:nucleoside 2-deoxyribosyltransferase